MTDDPALEEIRALRERLARLEALASATEGDPVTIIHDNATPTREERRQRSIAGTFQRDAGMERLRGLSALAEAGNAVAAAELAALHPESRMSLGFYSNARDAAVALGLANATDGSLTGEALR